MIAPEVAVIVTFDVTFDVTGAAAMLAADCDDAPQPVIPAAATKSRIAKNDPRARADLRFRPANVSSPTGPINERVTPVGE